MADSNAAGGLKWVKGEIFANLRRARDSLEKLAEPDPESAQANLGEAINALAEVRGMLSALQLIAPTRLTDELQRLCERLDAGQVSDAREASEALMLALIQLPDYLDKVVAGQSVAPLALLPSINDLRVSGGDVPLSEAELLVPTSVLSELEVPSADVQSAARRTAAEVRPQFHVFLLQWLRGESRDKGLANLGGLFRRFQECFGEGIFFDYFLVAEELVEALLEDRIAEDVKTKALIAHIDRIIKSLATDPRAWPEEQARALLFDLLSVMARCKPCSYPVEELLTSYGLSQGARQSRETTSPPTSGPAPVAFNALFAEAKKELLPIRAALDSFARGNPTDRDQLLRLEPLLSNLANRLSVGGVSTPVERLRQCSGAVAAIAHGSVPCDEPHLTQVAMDLVFVEAVLDELARGDSAEVGNEEPDALVSDALNEIRADMAKVEGIVDELADRPTDHQRLHDIPDQCHKVASALRTLSEDDAAEVLDLVEGQIQERFLESTRAPRVRELDLLAQAISGVDLYLAGKREGAPYGADLLVEARRAVETLRVEPSPTSTQIPEWSPFGVTELDAEYVEPRDPPTPVATSHSRDSEDVSEDSIPSDGTWDAEPSAFAAEELPAHEDSKIATLANTDEDLLGKFRAEAQEHLRALRSLLFLTGADDKDISVELTETAVGLLHSLTESARMAGEQSAAEVTACLGRLFVARQTQGVEPDSPLLQLLGRAVDALDARIQSFTGQGDEMVSLRDIRAHLVMLERDLPEEKAMAADTETSVPSMVLESEQPLMPQAREPTPMEQEAVDDFGEMLAPRETMSVPETAEDATGEEMPALAEEIPSNAEITNREAVAGTAAGYVPPLQDPELIGSFLEGARNIVDRLDNSLHDLQFAPTDPGPLAEMQRSLHTLKGSARLSGLTPIGDLSHALESLLGAVAHGEARLSDDTLGLTQRALDALSEQIRAVRQRSDLQAADELVQSLSLALEQGSADPPEAALQADVVTTVPDGGAGPEEGLTRAIPSGPKSATFASSAAEAVAPRARVHADLIDHLLSNAAEMGIYCSRLAQQSGAATDRLEELEQAVARLGRQLRKLEQETEAQVLHSRERDAESLLPELEGLDPLGLDRFSALQQLSRSLDETANDLAGLCTLLSDAQSESDTLLRQQARIADDLREGLLRTRMVPFTQAVPRLHRLVSQTAQQMGKEVRLEVSGAEVELDRDTQEHILAPLEHLLRNAVVHGIELPEQREHARKLPSGVISLSLAEDKNGVVIKVADDGAGLNLQAIHKCALDRGLIAKDAQVTNEALTKLILQSGFSTVEEASQTAGRGIGLDVVSTEVERLSGSFDWETDPGHGTSFAIRLPHSLAIIEALLVQLGNQIFAIPNAAIEGTSRISRADLEACYRGEEKDLSHGGRDFRLMYLGSLLQLRGIPDLGDDPWLPVLLARFGEQRIAFHVDHLLGSRRILVKPVGPKRGDTRWLSGESILPDDSLVLVLDLLGLMRSTDIQGDCLFLQPGPEAQKRRPCVMVVDDSLTVRQATSRMLQRQNMEVVTARDGIDALRRLEGRVPDVVVLDIEMPRMDGCELARQIRRSERLKDIPLIMISSRTGEKHRRHALDLGVDRYLGKPFQEMDLLDEISSVLAEASL